MRTHAAGATGAAGPVGLGLLVGGGLLGAAATREWQPVDLGSSIDLGAAVVAALVSVVLLVGVARVRLLGAVLAGLVVTSLAGGALGGLLAVSLGAAAAGVVVLLRERSVTPGVLLAPAGTAAVATIWAFVTGTWMRTFDESGTSAWYDVQAVVTAAALLAVVTAALALVLAPGHVGVRRLATAAPVLLVGLAAADVRTLSTCQALAADDRGGVLMTANGCAAGLVSQVLPSLLALLAAALLVACARVDADGYAPALFLTSAAALPAVIVLGSDGGQATWAGGLALVGAAVPGLATLARRWRRDVVVDQTT